MGFFSVLGDISRNKSNFKQWEQDERDKDAKRKALYQKGVGKDRFEAAKKRGDVIIDVITQMDQHSENMAEDIESVTQPLSTVAGFAGLGVGTFAGWKLFSKKVGKDFQSFHTDIAPIKEEANSVHTIIAFNPAEWIENRNKYVQIFLTFALVHFCLCLVSALLLLHLIPQ